MICEICTGAHPDYLCPKRVGYGLPPLTDSERAAAGLPPPPALWAPTLVEERRRREKARYRARRRADERMAS